MKSWSLLSSFGLTCSVFILSAASVFAFEGKIEMTMTNSRKQGEVMPMTYYIKDKKMRIEMTVPADKSGKKGKGGEMGMMEMIYNLQAHEMIMLMPQQSMYMVYPIPETAPSQQPSAAAAPSPEDPKHPAMQFKPTGRKEKIAGMEAEEYVGVSENKQTEMWVTKGMGKFMMASQGGGGPMGGGRRGPSKASGWEAFTQQGDFFPLRVIQREKEGAPESFRMETTNIDRTPPPDTLFVPPAEYKKFEIPNMGDAMRGMIPGSQR